jgi:hypothetical protein
LVGSLCVYPLHFIQVFRKITTGMGCYIIFFAKKGYACPQVDRFSSKREAEQNKHG